MIDAKTYLEHIRKEGERIPEVAAGHVDEPVPSCPGNTVGSLLLHTAAVCMFWTDSIIQKQTPTSDWTQMPTDPVEAHKQLHARFVKEVAARDPAEPMWTWAGEGQVSFWLRRAAQELAVHRWDFENAVGQARPIDAELAYDGIDELLFVFGPKTGDPGFAGAAEQFDENDRRLRIEATDVGAGMTITARPDRFETDDSAEADVTARGTASDLLLFLWGRVPPSALNVSGDAALLERWQERVKI